MPQLMLLLACAVHIGALAIWCVPPIRKNVQNWTWLTVLLALSAMLSHRINDLLGPPDYFSSLTGALISSVALFAVMRTRAAILHQLAVARGLEQLQESMRQLEAEAQNRGHVAEKLAALLCELREEIDYYEKLSAQHGLTPFTKNGGIDRTRTG